MILAKKSQNSEVRPAVNRSGCNLSHLNLGSIEVYRLKFLDTYVYVD